MSIQREPCCLCGLQAQWERPANRDAYRIECQRCGTFHITGSLLHTLDPSNIDEEGIKLYNYLPAHTRQTSEREVISVLDTRNWRDFAREHQATRVPRKLTLLLELAARRSSYPGDEVLVDAELDYPLLDAASDREAHYLLEALKERGDLTFRAMPLSGANKYECTVTPRGWQRIDPPAAEEGIPGRCFIAMSFDPSLEDAYERGISPAVRDCGAEPVRIDRIHHNEKICDKILAEIRIAQFMIADFTLQRGGVYFEAGFAMALGRPVIWTCRQDDFENTHFDTRQYNHIVWSTPEELRTKLTDRIRATIFK